MGKFLVWNTVSMAWTEIGLDKDDYPKIALELRKSFSSWTDVNRIVLGDVVASFTFESWALPLAMIPLLGIFLISPWPDWGYEQDYLERRIAKWERVPRWQHYLNPFRLACYPLAWLLSLEVRFKLKRAFLAAGSG